MFIRVFSALAASLDTVTTTLAMIRANIIVRFIYTIMEDNSVRFYKEDCNTRITHAELANGAGVKFAGEIICQKIPKFSKWILWEINNNSGHYGPAAGHLKSAAELIINNLRDDQVFESVDPRICDCLQWNGWKYDTLLRK